MADRSLRVFVHPERQRATKTWLKSPEARQAALFHGPASSSVARSRVLVTAGGKTQIREQGGGMHSKSQNHRRLHFGLGQNTTIERIEVFWPGPLYTNQTNNNVQADQVLKIVEPTP